MTWDLPQPYLIDIRVDATCIDHYGHANNAEYLRWIERASWAHSRHLGLTFDDYRTLNRGMVVHRHELDYLAPAFDNARLQLATWIVSCDARLTLERRFQLVDVDTAQTLLRGRTRFVCIDISSGRPKRMPARFIEVYGGACRTDAS